MLIYQNIDMGIGKYRHAYRYVVYRRGKKMIYYRIPRISPSIIDSAYMEIIHKVRFDHDYMVEETLPTISNKFIRDN